MSDRPSDGMELDELRDEFDWMYEFQSRMAERISGDADVHSLADYVGKLEAKNSELREERDTYRDLVGLMVHPDIPDQLAAENAKLRELVALMYRDMQCVLDMSIDTVWVDDIGTLRDEMDCHMQAMAELGMPPADYERRMRELGIEVPK